MLTLAVDSTANTATCALSEDGRLAALSTVNGLLTHSETLLPMVDEMLRHAGKGTEDVGLFAVSVGPGSFTGVRIGVAMVKGLAFGTGGPCVGVSTLEALAENLAGFGELVVPVMDARRSQVYTAVFRDGKRLTDDALIPLDALETLLEGFTGNVRFVGDGYALAHRYFADRPLAPRIVDTPALLVPQNAFSVALCAERVYRAAPDPSVYTDRALSPKYLRAPQAERERLEKLGQN